MINKHRLDELFKMGLMFDGKSYVGRDNLKDINFHYTEIMMDSDNIWNRKIKGVKAEIKRRNESNTGNNTKV